MKFKNLLTVLALSVIFTSCETSGGDDDDNSPMFSDVTLNGSATTAFVTVDAGDTLVLSGTYTDDVELASYTVSSSSTKATGADALSIDKSFPLSGTSVTDVQQFIIAETTQSGPYTIKVVVEDANGSTSGEAEFDIAVANETMATITLDWPTNNTEFKSGEMIDLSGKITDDKDITSVEITLEPKQMAGGLVAVGTTIYDETFNVPGATDTIWDFNETALASKDMMVPTITSAGSYKLTIYATDSDGNIAVLEREIWLKP